MRVYIDQSGKVEQTNKDTILSLSNKHQDAVIIKAKTKRQLQHLFRESKHIKEYFWVVFTAGLACLINRNKLPGKIIIDREYWGKEVIIKKNLLVLIRRKNLTIYFGLIGKQSRAHYLANQIASKKIKMGKIISFSEIINQIKKTEVGKRLKNA